MKGRTIYLGSRSSPCFVRIYEKGKQVLSQAHSVDLDSLRHEFRGNDLTHWVRCELEVKPKSNARGGLSHLEPDAYWGASRWTADLAQALTGDEYARIRIGSVHRATDAERTMRAMLTQYGRFLHSLRDDLGSWDCVGLQLGDELAKLDELGGMGASSAP